tara:strand:+ start:28174 stop:29397 length:1224 start_codon:yes stop_codon:yes gene_type:complete
MISNIKIVDTKYKAKKLAKAICNLIEEYAYQQDEFKAVHAPINFGENASHYILNCLKTTWVSSGGNYVNEFAEKLSEYTGSPYVIPVSSGTAALKLALLAVGIEKGSEVLVPSFTFVASANAVAHVNAYPNFIDIESKTFGIDSLKLKNYLEKNTKLQNKFTVNIRTGKRISALIAVHIFGNSCDIRSILEICKKYNIKLIEDCAGALGTFASNNQKKIHLGRFGDVGCLSFNGNKILTTGGGGAIITESYEIYEKALNLSTTARVPHEYEIEHNEIGWNDRMPNLNAAIGLSQLENFGETLKRKEKIYSLYKKNLNENIFCKFAFHDQFCKSNYWLNSLIIDEDLNINEFKKILYNELIENKIQIRSGWKPLNLLKMYKSNPSDNCSTAHLLANKIINLPSNFLLN